MSNKEIEIEDYMLKFVDKHREKNNLTLSEYILKAIEFYRQYNKEEGEDYTVFAMREPGKQFSDFVIDDGLNNFEKVELIRKLTVIMKHVEDHMDDLEDDVLPNP